MRILAIIACVAYWALLTALLLAPYPAHLIGLRATPWFPLGDIGMHLTAFTLLTLLVHAMRWPKWPTWTVVIVLLVYGATTESLQAFVPPRTVELKDYIDNFLGVVVGTAIYCAACRGYRTLKSPALKLQAEAQDEIP